MRIVKLKAENIKKLVAVEIKPGSDVVKITGKNAAGKTSVLDSIFWALGGAGNIQDKPLRKGEKKGMVELDLGDMVVRRSFTENATSLVIENKDGMIFKSPQAILDQLIGRMSFDPLEFMRQDSKKQILTLRQLTGVDTDKLDGMRAMYYSQRTLANTDAKRLEVQLESVVIPPEPQKPEGEEISISDLLAEIKTADETVELERENGKLVTSFRAEFEKRREKVEIQSNEIATMEFELQQAKDELAKSKLTVDTAKRNLDIQVDKILTIETIDPAPLREKLKTAEDQNAAFRAEVTQYDRKVEAMKIQVARKADFEKALKEKQSLSDDLTAKIEAVDAEKSDLIAQAKFPCEGLGFGDGVVTYSGLPLAQASAAEQLRVSMAMAMALNPKLRVIRITDGSLLDSESMKLIEEMAHKDDFQVWCEIVDESGKVGVVIEDGQVAAVN